MKLSKFSKGSTVLLVLFCALSSGGGKASQMF